MKMEMYKAGVYSAYNETSLSAMALTLERLKISTDKNLLDPIAQICLVRSQNLHANMKFGHPVQPN